MLKYCFIDPKITKKSLDNYGFNFDYLLDIGTEVISHEKRKYDRDDYPYWESTGKILGVILKEYSDSKLVYFWKYKDDPFKTVFPDETILKDLEPSFLEKFTSTTGFSRVVNNNYLKEISREKFVSEAISLISYFKPLDYNYNKELKIREYLFDNHKLLRLAYAFGLLDGASKVIVDGKEFEVDWNCWTSFSDKAASSYYDGAGNSLEFSKEFLKKIFLKEDFYNEKFNNLENIVEKASEKYLEYRNHDFVGELTHDQLIEVLYEEINDFKNNSYHKFYSNTGINDYFLLCYNYPEDSYFEDLSEAFQEKIIEMLEDKFSIIKNKLSKAISIK